MPKIAFIYPGQGSQAIGMGKALYDNFDAAKKVMHEINDTLKQNLSEMMFEGPLDTLTLTENTQPALLAASMMAQRVLEHESGKDASELCVYMAGHSLGEYSALCASRALSLADAALLVKVRGNAMQNAQPLGKGAMAAILGLELNQVEDLVSQFSDQDNLCVIANDNCPGQVVISGHRKAIDAAIMKAKEMGAKRSILLPVSAAFHSPLIKAAAPIMEQAFSSVDIHSPKVPIIANITASPLDSSHIEENLVKQITHRVRWRETINFLKEEEITITIEVGSGRILSNLVKRCQPSIETYSIDTSSDINTILDLCA